MGKLRVFATVGDSFRYPVKLFIPFLQRTGMSFLLLFAFIFFAAPHLSDVQLDALQRTPEEAQSASWITQLAFGLLFVFVYANLIIGIVQVLAGAPEGRKWFAIGTRELRFLLLIPLNILFLIVYFLFVFIVFALAGPSPSDQGGGVSMPSLPFVLAMVAVFLFFCYFYVRLLPLFTFIALDNRFALLDAWRVSKGSFWRIFFVFFLVMLLSLLLTLPVQGIAYLIFPIDFAGLQAAAAEGENGMVLLLEELSIKSRQWAYITAPIGLYTYLVFFSAMALVGLKLRDIPIVGSNADNSEPEERHEPGFD